MTEEAKISQVVDDVRRDALQSIKSLGRKWNKKETKSVCDLIIRLVGMIEVGRVEGLLSMEKCVEDIPEDAEGLSGLLRNSVMELVHGFSIDWVEENMTTVYWLDTPSGIDALKYFIVIEAIDLAYRSFNPYACITRFQYLIPVECRKNVMDKCIRQSRIYHEALEKEETERYMLYREDYRKAILKDSRINSYNIKELEERLTEASDEKLIDMIHHVTLTCLGNAFIGLSRDIQDRVTSLSSDKDASNILSIAENSILVCGRGYEYKYPDEMNKSVGIILDWFDGTRHYT